MVRRPPRSQQRDALLSRILLFVLLFHLRPSASLTLALAFSSVSTAQSRILLLSAVFARAAFFPTAATQSSDALWTLQTLVFLATVRMRALRSKTYAWLALWSSVLAVAAAAPSLTQWQSLTPTVEFWLFTAIATTAAARLESLAEEAREAAAEEVLRAHGFIWRSSRAVNTPRVAVRRTRRTRFEAERDPFPLTEQEKMEIRGREHRAPSRISRLTESPWNSEDMPQEEMEEEKRKDQEMRPEDLGTQREKREREEMQEMNEIKRQRRAEDGTPT